VSGNQAFGERTGIEVDGSDAVISGNTAYNDGGDGIYSTGSRSKLSGNTVHDNGTYGIYVSGDPNTVANWAMVSGNTAFSGLTGIYAYAASDRATGAMSLTLLTLLAIAGLTPLGLLWYWGG